MAAAPTKVVTITLPDGRTTTRTVDPNNFESLTELASSFLDPAAATSQSTRPNRASATSASESATASSEIPTTLLTSSTPTQGSTGAAAGSSSTAINASSAADGANNETSAQSQNSCNSISCNPGLQAAIAVPVVVGTLLIFALAFLCLRRRKRRQQRTGACAAAPISEKRRPKTPKKWSRHLRVFSFDAELLMGGRFSSSNSLASRDAHSQRSANNPSRQNHNASPSMASIGEEEEVAPPYRDAVSHAQPPSTVPMAAGMTTSRSTDPFPRPDSTATAPPPYPNAAAAMAAGAGTAAAAGGVSRATSRASTTAHTPMSARSINDPFRNDPVSPVSPVGAGADASPFVDPPTTSRGGVGAGDERSPISPSESMMVGGRRGELADDAVSLSSDTEVVEAQMGRRLSTREARRV